MHNEFSNDLRASTARKDAPPFESQPLPASDAPAADAREGIRPVADATYDRVVASGDIRTSNSSLYVAVRLKFAIALAASSGWFALSVSVALPWIAELSGFVGHALAIMIVAGVALVPAFMNSFLVMSLMLDRRPRRHEIETCPPVSILIAAYNEEGSIADTLRQFIRQRQRWARGMVGAFRNFPGILPKPRMSTLFVWWNALFPWLDLAYTLFFIPGVVLALFGIYWIAGPMTLALLPMALLMNYAMYHVGSHMFARNERHVRRNIGGFLIYAFVYSLILQPACVAGYLSEILGLRKSWGTK